MARKTKPIKIRQKTAALPEVHRQLTERNLCALMPYHPEIEGDTLRIQNGSPFKADNYCHAGPSGCGSPICALRQGYVPNKFAEDNLLLPGRSRGIFWFMQGSALSPRCLVWLCGFLVAATGCRKPVSPVKGEPMVQVTEMRQRSVTEDPAVMGNFPNGWQIDKPSGPPMPAAESEIGEFQDRLAKMQLAPLVLEDLAPGATRTVELPLSGPSGLNGVVRWVGTTSPLKVTASLAGALLTTTGTTYHFGRDRGGTSVNAQTTTGGPARISVTNTSGVAVKLRIVFAASAL
jgi:hypothetical protein